MTKRNSRCRGSGVICLLVLIMAMIGTPAFAQDVNQAMESFMQAMAGKNPKGILAAFSQQKAWLYQPYEIGTGRALKGDIVNPNQMAQDFQNKRGWYNFFLADPNGYTFRLNFMHNKPWKKYGPDTFVAPDSADGKTYITWRLEGQRWIIFVIGETTP